MNIEIKKRIVYLTNCSYAKINLSIKDDQEFINQFTYKYNIRLYKNDKLILKSEYNNIKAMPLDLYYDNNNILQKKINDKFTSLYGAKTSEKKYEDYQNINKILKLNDKQNSDSEFKLLSYFLFNEFNLKMSLEELSESEKIIYSKNYSWGQTNYLKNNEPLKKVRAYDINSEHPYLMYDPKLLLPIRKGTDMMLNNISEIDLSKVGLYLLNIEFNDETKYFKPVTNKPYYTVSNYFIEILNKTKTKYSLYKHNNLSFNAIVYEKDECINLYSLIGYQISKLYDNKKNGCKISKALLQKLLGVFSKKLGDKRPVESYEERLIYNSCFVHLPNLYFRFKNFIYDACRVNMYKYIEYCHNNGIVIYRIKADSIHISKKLPDGFIDSKELGKMKFEGKYSLKTGFKNVNDTTYKQYLKK